jgi:hypothetical protein
MGSEGVLFSFAPQKSALGMTERLQNWAGKILGPHIMVVISISCSFGDEQPILPPNSDHREFILTVRAISLYDAAI